MARAKLDITKPIRTKVSGVSYPNPDGSDRQRLIRKYCRKGMELKLVPDPDNEYDPDAIALWITVRRMFLFRRSFQIGYVWSEINGDLLKELGKGRKLHATISDVTGGGRDKNYGVNYEIVVS